MSITRISHLCVALALCGAATPALADWTGKGNVGASFATGNSENQAASAALELKNTVDKIVNLRIFADDGSPGETISQQPTRSSSLLVDKTGVAVYRFDLVLAPFTLAGGKDWYLSVVNQFDVRDPTAVWYWLLSNATDENFYRSADGDPWLSDSTGNLAFQVIGNSGRAIPLPGSLLLLLAGLAGLNLVRLRSRLRLTTPVNG